MFSLLHSFAHLNVLASTAFSAFQPEAPAGSGPAGAPASSSGGAGGMSGGLSQLGLMALMMVVFYLVLIRPQQKKQKQLDLLLKGLKKGQKVRTTGGIRGQIIDFKTEQGDEVVLEIADKVKINVLRTHVSGVVEVEAEKKS